MTGHDLDRAQMLADQCERAAGYCGKGLLAEVESLRAKLAAAEQERDALRLVATEAVDAIGSGHSEHWDPTMSYGAGCAACNRERELRDRLRSSLAAAEQPEPTDNACRECGIDNPVWFAPNVVWNAVMGDHRGFLCPVCFIRRAEASGLTPTGWQLQPEPAPEQP